MDKKIIAIITAVALIAAIIIVASFAACNDNNNPGETDGSNQASLPEDEESGNETGNGSSTPSEIGNPGEYTYADRNETVYVSSSAATLRTADYEAKGSIPHGTQLQRTGLSTDEANYWSKVTHDGETYYIASKLLTDVNPAEVDAGFTTVDKTVRLNGNGETGTLFLNIRDIPSMQSSVIGQVTWEMEIKVIAENSTTEWYKIEFVDYEGATKTGYIASDAKYYVTANTETNTEAGNNNTNTEAAPEGAGK